MNAPPPPGGFDPRYGAPPGQPFAPPPPFVPGASGEVNVYAPPTAHVTAFAPVGAGYMPYAQPHPGARTALQLAILSTFLCAFIAPFAWYKGLQARAAIRQNPTLYTGESEATAAIWIAGVYTIVAAIAVVVVTIYFALGVASGLR